MSTNENNEKIRTELIHFICWSKGWATDKLSELTLEQLENLYNSIKNEQLSRKVK